MQITSQLLQKYSEGKCSDAEKRAIEQWLQSNTVADDIIKKQTIPDQTESKIWNNIQKSKSQLDSPKRVSMDLYSKVARYAAAACVAIMIYLTGALLPTPFDNETKRDLVEISPSIDKGSIYVSRLLKKSKRYSADNYIVNFRGAIRIYSTEKDQKTIVCNGEPFILQPHKYYFLIETRKGGIQILDEEPGELDHFASLKTTFQLCA